MPLLEHSQMEIASNLDGYVANFINASQAISNVFAKFDLTKIDDNIRYELEDLNEASAKVLHASLNFVTQNYMT